MKFETTYRLENYVLQARWEDFPLPVKERLKGCFLDLMGALLIGSRSEQFSVGLSMAQTVYGAGEIPVIGSDRRFSRLGASCAMGHSSNAFDIDDGHNLIRAHPGTSFIAALLAGAWEKDLSRNEFLTALSVSYEATVRMGRAMMDYYNYAHSSGTFGAVGVAAGLGRIFGLDRETLHRAISIAEFNAPLVPGIRSVEYPSMNKDGVPFGVLIGCLAVEEARCGFVGKKHLLEAEEYAHYLSDLGEKYQVMDLYFKPYPCCRWAHPALDASLGLMKDHGISPDRIESVTVKTFHRATLLSKIVPQTEDEAQYNIAYPIAAALVHGAFGYAQLKKDALGDGAVIEMMKRLSFETDEAMDKKFPEERLCRVTIRTKNGEEFVSPVCSPRGEASEHISLSWLGDKFCRITGDFYAKAGQDALIEMISGEKDLPIRSIVSAANQKEYYL